MSDYLAFRGTGEPDPDVSALRLPEVPPWRDSLRARSTGTGGTSADGGGRIARGMNYQIDHEEAERVNAALYLRRPLLVTGEPGTGKSSLAYAIAVELGLGEVLRWPITSKSTLREGLYHYDAIGRLQEANLREIEARHHDSAAPEPVDIGSYIRLGPLGTVLLPADRPRVLLVDELDKSDIDLPNDLLNVFEEGEFTIQEIARLPGDHPRVTIMTADEGSRVELPAEPRGVVRCAAFPLVIITSNGERQFPPAFLRRCLQLTLPAPDAGKLARIIEAHLPVQATDYADLIEEFLGRRSEGELATDELLNAVFLRYSALRPAGESAEQLASIVMPYLDKALG